MRIKFKFLAFMVSMSLLGSIASAQSISVNFHLNDDDTGPTPAQADHELTAGETAGIVPIDGALWNNISVGARAAHNTAEAIFPSTTLMDDMGNAAAATIVPSVDSTYFVGYAASAASVGDELANGVGDDNLFNSYLALNGPSGDGTPVDLAVLQVSGLGAAFTATGYDLIIYSDSDRRDTGNAVRESVYTVTPTGGTAVTVNVQDDDTATVVNIFDGTYIESTNTLSSGGTTIDEYSNYTVISGMTASGFDIEISSPDGGRGAISGFQIRVPNDTDCVLGDVDMNGTVEFLDIQPFIGVLSGNGFQCEADCDEDGTVSFLDIQPFITILAGG